MRVNDIFQSLQGEGYWTGVAATFIRLQGCEVGCPWCDTKYAWKMDGGKSMTVDDICAQLDQTRHVVITGGEPLLQNLDELIAALHTAGRYVQIETAGGTPFYGDLPPDYLTWSPKPNLLYQADPTVWKMCDEVKFVIDDSIGIDVIHTTIKQLEVDRPRMITLMPEGLPPTQSHIKLAVAWVTQLSQYTDMPIRFGMRLQCILQIK